MWRIDLLNEGCQCVHIPTPYRSQLHALRRAAVAIKLMQVAVPEALFTAVISDGRHPASHVDAEGSVFDGNWRRLPKLTYEVSCG